MLFHTLQMFGQICRVVLLLLLLLRVPNRNVIERLMGQQLTHEHWFQVALIQRLDQVSGHECGRCASIGRILLKLLLLRSQGLNQEWWYVGITDIIVAVNVVTMGFVSQDLMSFLLFVGRARRWCC